MEGTKIFINVLLSKLYCRK